MVQVSLSKNTQDYIILITTILGAALAVFANAGTEITTGTIILAIVAGLNALLDVNKNQSSTEQTS